MAEIKLTIPDDKINDILNAFDAIYRGRGAATKAAWAKQHVAQYVKNIVNDANRKSAVEAVAPVVIDIT